MMNVPYTFLSLSLFVFSIHGCEGSIDTEAVSSKDGIASIHQSVRASVGDVTGVDSTYALWKSESLGSGTVDTLIDVELKKALDASLDNQGNQGWHENGMTQANTLDEKIKVEYDAHDKNVSSEFRKRMLGIDRLFATSRVNALRSLSAKRKEEQNNSLHYATQSLNSFSYQAMVDDVDSAVNEDGTALSELEKARLKSNIVFQNTEVALLCAFARSARYNIWGIKLGSGQGSVDLVKAWLAPVEAALHTQTTALVTLENNSDQDSEEFDVYATLASDGAGLQDAVKEIKAQLLVASNLAKELGN